MILQCQNMNFGIGHKNTGPLFNKKSVENTEPQKEVSLQNIENVIKDIIHEIYVTEPKSDAIINNRVELENVELANNISVKDYSHNNSAESNTDEDTGSPSCQAQTISKRTMVKTYSGTRKVKYKKHHESIHNLEKEHFNMCSENCNILPIETFQETKVTNHKRKKEIKGNHFERLENLNDNTDNESNENLSTIHIEVDNSNNRQLGNTINKKDTKRQTANKKYKNKEKQDYKEGSNENFERFIENSLYNQEVDSKEAILKMLNEQLHEDFVKEAVIKQPKKRIRKKNKNNRIIRNSCEPDADLAVDNFDFDEAIRNTERKIEEMLLENQHLKTLEINIPWEIPLSHQIERTVGTRLKKEQREKFKQLDFPMKKGPYTKSEDQTIKANFQEFCEHHNLRHDPEPFLNFVYEGKSLLAFPERLKFVQYIAKGLNNRKLYQIYSRFQTINSNVKKGKFNSQEDAILLKYIQTYPESKHKFSDLAKILNRSRKQLKQRYCTLTELEPFTRTPSQKKVKELVAAMMMVFGVLTVDELKTKTIKDFHWKKISTLMADTPVYELKSFWRLSVKTRLFNYNIKINKVLRKVINSLYRRNITDWKELDWTKIVKPFEQKYYTAAFIYTKFKDLKRCYVPKEYQNNPMVCLRLLRDLYKHHPRLCRKVRSYKLRHGAIVNV